MSNYSKEMPSGNNYLYIPSADIYVGYYLNDAEVYNSRFAQSDMELMRINGRYKSAKINIVIEIQSYADS